MLFIHIFGYVICTIQNSEDFDILDLLNSVVNIDEIAMSFDNDDVPDDLIDFADNLNNENFNLSDMGLYLNEEPTILAEDDCSSVGNMFKKYDCSFDYESVTEDNYVSSLNCSENQKIFTSLSANGFCINGSQQMDFTVNSLEDVSQYEYSDVPLENVPIINRILGSHQSGSSNDSTKYSQENAASIFEVDNTSQNGISNFETKGSQQMDFTVNSLEDVSQCEYSDVPLENVPIINRILGSHQSGSSNDSTKYSQENAASIFEVDNTSQNGISNFETKGSQQMDFTVNSLEDVSQYEYSDVPLENVPIINRILGSHQSGSSNDSTKYSQENAASIFEVDNTSQNGISNFETKGSQQMDFTVNSLEDVSQYEYSDVPLENVPIINRILGSHQSGSSNDSTKYSQENAASIFEVDNTSQNGISNFEENASLNKINQERSIVNQVNETKIDSTDKIYTKGTKNTSLAKKSTDFDTLKDGIKTKEKYNDLFKLLQKVEMKYPGKIREKYGPVFYSKYEKILEILRKKKKELSSKNKAKQAPRSNDKIIINNPVYNITTPQMLLVLPFPIFPSNNMTLTLIPLALTTTLTDIKAISYLPITGPPTSDYKNMQEDTNVVYQNSTKKSSPDSEKKDNVFLEKKLNSQKPCHSKSKDMTHNINYSDKNNSCVQEFVNFEKFTSNLNNIFNDECTKKAYDSIFSNSKDLVSSSKTKARTLVNNQYLYLFNILSIIQNDGYLNIDYFESSLDNFDDKFNKIKLIESFLTSTFEAKFTFLDKPDIQYKETTAYKELLSYYDDLRLPNISDYALRHTYKLIYKNTNSLINSGYIDRDCDLSILNCFVYDKMCLLNDSLEKILVCQSFLFVTGVLNANAKVKQMLVLLNLINYLQFGHTKWDSKWDLANFLGCLLRSTNPNLKYKNIISFTKCFNKLYESRLLLQSLHYNEKASRNVAILMGMFVPFIVSDQNSFDIIFTGSIDKQLDRNDIFNTIYQGNIGLMMKFFKKIKFIN